MLIKMGRTEWSYFGMGVELISVLGQKNLNRSPNVKKPVVLQVFLEQFFILIIVFGIFEIYLHRLKHFQK